jgi:2-isopropylmalate synthase
MVTTKSGMPIQPNKAIVGANAFAHESGIHQDGMLKNKTTYEIINPDILGLASKALVLGKHSGRNAFKTHIDELVKNTIYKEHIEKDPTIYDALFASFKKLADAKKSGVTDQDLYAILDDCLNLVFSGLITYEFGSLNIMGGSGILSTATVSIKKSQSNEMVTDAATGHGPVNAIFNAINRILGIKNVLSSYQVKAVGEGSDSPGQVVVQIKQSTDSDLAPKSPSKKQKLMKGQIDARDVFSGRGMDEDILVASAKAYINAVNRMLNAERRYINNEGRNVAV